MIAKEISGQSDEAPTPLPGYVKVAESSADAPPPEDDDTLPPPYQVLSKDWSYIMRYPCHCLNIDVSKWTHVYRPLSRCWLVFRSDMAFFFVMVDLGAKARIATSSIVHLKHNVTNRVQYITSLRYATVCTMFCYPSALCVSTCPRVKRPVKPGDP